MSKMKLRVNPEAISDLSDIKRYIRDELYNPDAADRVVNDIIKAYKGLKDFPLKGPALDSVITIKTDFRYLVCGSYYIFYKAEKELISIYRVINARRDYIRILFGRTLSGTTEFEDDM